MTGLDYKAVGRERSMSEYTTVHFQYIQRTVNNCVNRVKSCRPQPVVVIKPPAGTGICPNTSHCINSVF